MTRAVPDDPRALGLPYQGWWPHQREAVEQVIAHFDRGVRVVVLESPPGTGKSGIAAGVISAMGKRGLIMVSTKALQDQYERQVGNSGDLLDLLSDSNTQAFLALLKGRGNFPCVRPSFDTRYTGMDLTAEDCTHSSDNPCEVRWPGHRISVECAYFRQVERASRARIVCTNYDYALTAGFQHDGLAERDLGVMDEAHLLEEHVMNWADLTITDRHLSLMRWPAPTYKTKPDSWREWAVDRVNDVDAAIRKLGVTLPSGSPKRMIEHLRELRRLKDWRLRLVRLRDSDDDNWVFDDHDGYRFMPVWVDSYVQKQVLDKFTHVLLMTATVLDRKIFCRLLGIDQNKIGYVRLPSVYAAVNRPVYYEPVGSMGKRTKDEVQPALLKRIQHIVDEHGDSSGVIHTNSYAIAEAVREGVSFNHHRVFRHGTADRSAVLSEYLRTAPEYPSVLISPSMTTGVSFDDDAARWQVIAKVPWPYLGDKRVARRFFSSREWYAYRTAADLIQTTGRAVRSTDDFAESWILDSDFYRLASEHGRYFPDWWRSAFIR